MQDVRFILQVEASPPPSPAGTPLSPVVVALTPQVADLVSIFDQQTALLPPAACDRHGLLRTGLLASDEPSAGLVDELWIVVLLHFVEVLLDLGHLFLAVCTLLLPWRALQLLVAVSETDKCATWREARELHREYCDAKECLADYRAGLAPLMNSLSKEQRGTNSHARLTQDHLYHPHYRWYSHYHAPAVTNRLKDLEQRTWREYKNITDRLLKQAEKSSATSIQALGAALGESRAVEELRLQQWAHRGVFNTLSEEAEGQWRVIAKKPREQGDWDEAGEGEHVSISGLLVQVVEATQGETARELREKERLVEHALVGGVLAYCLTAPLSSFIYSKSRTFCDNCILSVDLIFTMALLDSFFFFCFSK